MLVGTGAFTSCSRHSETLQPIHHGDFTRRPCMPSNERPHTEPDEQETHDPALAALRVSSIAALSGPERNIQVLESRLPNKGDSCAAVLASGRSGKPF